MRFVTKHASSSASVHEKPDSELSGAELRFKYCTTKQEIEEAKRRLQNAYTDSDDVDELKRQFAKTRSTRNSKLEQALFYGLERIVSQEERTYIVDLMTSGDPNKLAQAAHILFEIRNINNVNHSNINDSSREAADESRVVNSIRSILHSKTSEAQSKIIKRMTMAATTQEAKLPPMPKYVTLKADFDVYARYGKLIKFKDDGWDGSLSDAFSRMYSDKSDSDHQDGEGGGKKENKNRVIVTEARRQAAKAGIEKGDVVTHVNMEEFHGDADELRAKIQSFYNVSFEKNGSTIIFSMTLNADQITADELRKLATVDR